MLFFFFKSISLFVSCVEVIHRLLAKLSVCLIKYHAIKTYRGWRYSSTILDLGTGWRWVVSFTTQPLYFQGKSPRYPLDRRLGEEKNLFPLPATESRVSSP
jgi:hypothetical protein